MALTTLYLKLMVDGKQVQGLSTTKGYAGQIEVDSFSWSLTAKHTEEARKVHTEVRPKRITLSKVFDRSTRVLCGYMQSRKKFASAELTMVSMMLGGSSGDENLKMMQMVLYEGFVEEVNLQASESGKSVSVKERVTLSFRKCKLMYFPTDINAPGRAAALTFDLEQPSIKS